MLETAVAPSVICTRQSASWITGQPSAVIPQGKVGFATKGLDNPVGDTYILDPELQYEVR